MAALWNRASHYNFSLWFLLLSIFFFFFTVTLWNTADRYILEGSRRQKILHIITKFSGDQLTVAEIW